MVMMSPGLWPLSPGRPSSRLERTLTRTVVPIFGTDMATADADARRQATAEVGADARGLAGRPGPCLGSGG